MSTKKWHANCEDSMRFCAQGFWVGWSSRGCSDNNVFGLHEAFSGWIHQVALFVALLTWFYQALIEYCTASGWNMLLQRGLMGKSVSTVNRLQNGMIGGRPQKLFWFWAIVWAPRSQLLLSCIDNAMEAEVVNATLNSLGLRGLQRD